MSSLVVIATGKDAQAIIEALEASGKAADHALAKRFRSSRINRRDIEAAVNKADGLHAEAAGRVTRELQDSLWNV